MRIITKNFFESSSIPQTEDSVAIMDFLSSPGNVSKMIVASEKHLPALSAVVEELEQRFGDCDTFPLNHDGEDKNAPNRRNVGWMVRFIMREYGYSPVVNSERTRIGSNSGSKYFRNAAVYEKTDDKPNYVMLSNTMVTSKTWNAKNMMIGKDDPLYKDTKKRMRDAGKRLKQLKMSKDFLVSYLLRTGFNYCISLLNMILIFNGVQVPCLELCEAIENALSLFEQFDIVDQARTSDVNESKTIWNSESINTEDPSTKYILGCCLDSEQVGIGKTLKNLFDNNAAGLYWKAKRDDYLPLVDYARENYNHIKNKTELSKESEEYYYLKDNMKFIKNRIKDMADSCVELEEREYFQSNSENAELLYKQLEEEPRKIKLGDLFDLIESNWIGLKDWTITYRFLGTMISVEKNWNSSENDIYRLCEVAGNLIKKGGEQNEN